MSDLTKQLIEVQKELKAPKGQYNSFSKFKYRSAEDVLEAVKPINVKLGLLLTLSDEPILIGDWHYIKATATITNGEDVHAVAAYARESQVKKGMDDSQITGTASSYARKYALNGLYLIDDTKDADTDEYQSQSNGNKNEPAKRKTNPEPVTSEQVGSIKVKAMEFAKARDQEVDAVYKVLKISDITKLNKTQASAALKQLDAWLSSVNKGA